MQGSEIQGDELVIVGEGYRGGDRFPELHDKHERERLKRCGLSGGEEADG